MFDSFLIEEGSLANEYRDGVCIGFQFAVRIADYRGEYLSLQTGYYVNVDGTEYPLETQRFEINGKPPRTFAELATAVWEHWDFDDAAILHIACPGGLSKGRHRIGLQPTCLASYGYTPNDEKYVTDPPVPGTGEGTWKNRNVAWFDMEIE